MAVVTLLATADKNSVMPDLMCFVSSRETFYFKCNTWKWLLGHDVVTLGIKYINIYFKHIFVKNHKNAEGTTSIFFYARVSPPRKTLHLCLNKNLTFYSKLWKLRLQKLRCQTSTIINFVNFRLTTSTTI